MKKILLLLVALLAGAMAWAENITDYISDVMVIGGTKTEVNSLKETYTNQGWIVIDKDLNDGCGSGSDYIYLLYKQVSGGTASPFITDFVLTKGSSAPATITYNDCTYSLVKYNGGDRFIETKGDLNSHAGGDYIHLYYTTNEFDSKCTAIKSITFNKTKDGAVVNKDTNEGYDLNSGAGGDYIYMHLNKAQGWIPVFNVTSSQCYINDFDGPKAGLTYLNIPLYINGAQVLYFGSNFAFAEFTNLETITFHENTVIDEMPSMKNCTKFKHVNTIKSGVVEPDITPPAMKRIRAYVFEGTAIEKITLDQVDMIDAYAFRGCANLSEVNMKHAAIMEDLAFGFIPQRCRINYEGPFSDWNPMAIQLSPNLVVWASGDMTYMGWCGATNETSNNTLYWTMDLNKHLKINSAVLMWDSYPREQLITNHGWTTRDTTVAIRDVTCLTLEHVDTIAENEFINYKSLKTVDIKSGTRIIGNLAFESCDSLSKVYLPSCLSRIRHYAFRNCAKLADVYFDGSLQQWNGVIKEGSWNSYLPDDYKEHWRCTVYFNTNGLGLTPDPQTNLWSNESKVQKPNVQSVAQFVLAGWYKDAELNMPWDFNNDIVLGDMTLYAKWSEILNGDVNCDGMVDISDVNIIINIMLEKANVSDFPGNADLNGDDMIDIQDINHVINIMLKKI